MLGPALLRPGRFDRTVGLERPNEDDRLEILSLHAKSRRLDPGADLRTIGSRAHGMTGADLANVMNEAALLAARARVCLSFALPARGTEDRPKLGVAFPQPLSSTTSAARKEGGPREQLPPPADRRHDETGKFELPEQVELAVDDLAGKMRVGLLALSVGVGMKVMNELIEEKLTSALPLSPGGGLWLPKGTIRLPPPPRETISRDGAA